MKKLSITDITEMSNSEVRKLKGTFIFTSTIAMGHLIKRLQQINRNYEGDYAKREVVLN